MQAARAARWLARSVTLQRGAAAPRSTMLTHHVAVAPTIIQNNIFEQQQRFLSDGPRKRTKRKAKKVRKAAPKAEEEPKASAAGAGAAAAADGEEAAEAKPEEEESSGGGFLSGFRKQMADEMKKLEEEEEKKESKREKRRAKKAAKGESAEGGKDAEGAAEEGDGEKDAAAKPSFSDKFGGFMKDLSESEAGKAVSDAAGKVSEAASQTKEALEKEAADSAAEEKKTGKKQGKKGKDGMVTSAVKETVTEVAKEFTESDEGKRASPYQVPLDRRREAVEQRSRRERVVEANDDATGVELHKSSVWESRWKDATENSEFATKVSDAKIQFEESENVVARMVKFGIDKVASLGNEGKGDAPENDQALVVQDIMRLDPGFDLEEFTTHIEVLVAPAVLEAYYAGDAQVLQEWCSDLCYKKFEADFQQREQIGQVMECQIMDLEDMSLLQCQQMDEFPVLLFSFSTVSNLVVRNKVGEVIEGGEDDVKKTMWIIGLRRNPDELDRLLAWEVVDLQAHGSADFY